MQEPSVESIMSFVVTRQNEDTCNALTIQQRRVRRTLLFVTALSTLLLVGATFGWGPIQLLFEQHGIFASECTTTEALQELAQDGVCSAQTDKLLRVGLVAQLSIVTSPALGVLYDKIGGPNLAVVMGITSLCGMSLVTVAIRTAENFLYVGFTLMALAASMGSLLIVGLSFYFQNHAASRVIFVLNVLFDAGAMTFWILWVLQDLLNADLMYVWLGYFVLAVLIHGTGGVLWRLAVPHNEQEEKVELVAPEKEPDDEDDDANREGSEKGNDDKDIKEYTAREETSSTEAAQASRIPFVCLSIFFSLQVLGVSWNFATQRDFLGHLGDDDYNNRYLTIFTLSTPLSILGAPLIDWCILHLGWIQSLQVVNCLALGYSTIKVVTTNLNAQIVGFVIFSFCRSFVFGLSFSFLPKIVMGPIIGRAQGIMTGLAGLLNLINIPMASFAINQMDGDFFWPNVFFVLIYVPCVLSIVVLGRHWKDNDCGSNPDEKDGQRDDVSSSVAPS